MSGMVHELKGEQRAAVDPDQCVWLSASAGTGKTQVLSARVLRLLLKPDNDPSQILCLTFTKAGAAEMAVRVNDVLARWVRMDDIQLRDELKNLGASADPATRERARSLFASVLDTPGGGLRINTIHAFSQWLLSAFPQEAGIQPGSRALDDRQRDLMSRQVLADMLVAAKAGGDQHTLDAIAQLSLRKGADDARKWLMICADASHLWYGTGAWKPPMRARVCSLLGLTSDASLEDAAALCSDDQFDMAALRACLATFSDWSTPTGQNGAEIIRQWIARDNAGRLETLDSLLGKVLKKDGGAAANVMKRDPGHAVDAERLLASIVRVQDTKTLVNLVDIFTPSLELGRKFALLWDEAKAREGYIDFDDQIRRAAGLLSDANMADWIRYKLDRQFDHILIDEAQDTNEQQWDIIFALIGDFFSGAGARDDKLRTLFAVGDYKQAIFRFQGTSPENFEAAKHRVETEMNAAAVNAEAMRANLPVRRLQRYGLGQSFRTAAPVLDFVDNAIAAIGWDKIGLKEAPDPHIGQVRPGLVTLWNPVTGVADEDESGNDQNDGDEDNWLTRHDRMMADNIARQIKQWMEDGFPLVKGTKRNATPGDIMILVRMRRELASLIVARLYAAGVPVAGVDRLRLGNPLAVKDLMAAMRFAAQPLDDLSLANLLVSPLLGWTQQDLLDHGYRDKKVRLWDY
ncbi:MAG: UvrD-helicase domain-containing protein, partial [Pontixanthobacter sp.]